MAEDKGYGTEIHEVEKGSEHGAVNILHSIQARYAKVDPASYLRRPDESSSSYWVRRLGSLKPIELLLGEYNATPLRRYLNAFHLIFFGIGAIIGTGKHSHLLNRLLVS